MSEAVVQVRDVCHRFGQRWVHQHLNYTVTKGSISAVVGGSGSGKTTLLRCLINLHRPHFGTVTVLGIDVHRCASADMDRLRQRCGVVFQYNALFSSMNVLDNLCFALREMTSLNERLQQELAAWRLHQVGLSTDTLLLHPAQLSGGMRKRVALARALMLDPEILFLDEPTAGLDPRNADGFERLLLQLRQALNLTIVVITHDIDTLWSLPDTVAFLGDGRILQHAPLEQLLQYRHPLVQRYFSVRKRPAMSL